MKKLFVLLLGLSCITGFAHAADAGLAVDDSGKAPTEFHKRIAAIVAALEKAHPTAQSFQAPALTPPEKTGRRKTKAVTLHLANGKNLLICLAAIEKFDWKTGKRSDVPQGTKAAGRLAQMLYRANATLNVVAQAMDDDDNLETTFEKAISLETAAAIFKQVPGTQGVTEEQNGHAGSSTSTGIFWNITPEE